MGQGQGADGAGDRRDRGQTGQGTDGAGEEAPAAPDQPTHSAGCFAPSHTSQPSESPVVQFTAELGAEGSCPRSPQANLGIQHGCPQLQCLYIPEDYMQDSLDRKCVKSSDRSWEWGGRGHMKTHATVF